MPNWTINIMLTHQQFMFYPNCFVLNINMQKSWKYSKIRTHILSTSYLQQTIATILCGDVCLSFHTHTHIAMNLLGKKKKSSNIMTRHATNFEFLIIRCGVMIYNKTYIFGLRSHSWHTFRAPKTLVISCDKSNVRIFCYNVWSFVLK